MEWFSVIGKELASPVFLPKKTHGIWMRQVFF
jgi:hypothetical protein